MNVAEKRTAETRSKVAAVEDGAVPKDASTSELGGGVGTAHSGLALLPIVAILCGVAVGLATVALGVLLLVRGRGGGAEDAAEGGGAAAAAAGDDSGDGRGKYDAVATNVPPDEDFRTRQIRQGELYKKKFLVGQAVNVCCFPLGWVMKESGLSSFIRSVPFLFFF